MSFTCVGLVRRWFFFLFILFCTVPNFRDGAIRKLLVQSQSSRIQAKAYKRACRRYHSTEGPHPPGMVPDRVQYIRVYIRLGCGLSSREFHPNAAIMWKSSRTQNRTLDLRSLQSKYTTSMDCPSIKTFRKLISAGHSRIFLKNCATALLRPAAKLLAALVYTDPAAEDGERALHRATPRGRARH